ncbi:hypothetical protein I4P46_02400 [Clostridioides difficile]|nr:hypothetical protein [Clostridioides difficile]EGT4910249.1 hypothetical protein [Clostridioides difficile]MBF9826571.1 hypothetical protein [Clostridioides difficile]MBG0292812.1 hypothetical protein [Clostridioides difficile]MBH6893862.1 hypothetical protein [Clostridioides difficile]
MPPASVYICDRTVKKRRGYYSEQDVFLSPCPYVYGEGGMYETTYYGVFNLSNSKYITVPTSTKYEKYATRVYFISGENMINSSSDMKQVVTLELIPDPNIIINEDLGVISDSCNISYRIPDSNTSVKFDVTEKLNDVVISKKNYALDGNYTLSLTDEHLSTLSFNSKNNITIELSTYQGGKFLDKTVTFTKGNTKPKINVTSYNSTTATFTVIDTDNNLSKIEWYLDDVLKETITTDLTAEKTINYELTDNAIHTLKIVATDAENETAEKVLSISKEIMPLQSDATLQDISSKLVEIGEGFRNGKTSIINTLALKNIEANLNNTLVELSEKIKLSFDSSDASVQDLINQLTQANNTINQLNSKYKVAKGTAYSRENTSLTACLYDPSTSHGDTEVKPGYWFDFSGIEFTPDLFFAECDYQPFSSTIHKNFVFVVRNIPSISNSAGFVVNVTVSKVYGDTMFKNSVNLFTLGKRNVYMNNNGVRVPAYKTESSYTAYNWYSIKFT